MRTVHISLTATDLVADPASSALDGTAVLVLAHGVDGVHFDSPDVAWDILDTLLGVVEALLGITANITASSTVGKWVPPIQIAFNLPWNVLDRPEAERLVRTPYSLPLNLLLILANILACVVVIALFNSDQRCHLAASAACPTYLRGQQRILRPGPRTGRTRRCSGCPYWLFLLSGLLSIVCSVVC